MHINAQAHKYRSHVYVKQGKRTLNCPKDGQFVKKKKNFSNADKLIHIFN